MKIISYLFMSVFFVTMNICVDAEAQENTQNVLSYSHDHYKGGKGGKDDSEGDDDDSNGEKGNVAIHIEILKDVNGTEESYEIEGEIYGDSLESVEKVKVTAPVKSKKLQYKSKLAFNTVIFQAKDMSFEKLEDEFPEGEYKFDFSPKSKFESIKVDIAYDNFPSAPEITFPADGDTGVSTGFTVEWNAITDENVTALRLELESSDENDSLDESFSMDVDLSLEDTSFIIPAGLLLTNTTYELALVAITSGNEISYATSNVISFTTGNE